ncbi:MAG TPA: endo-1,4-beta-xylanase [Chthoniobacteraceae bacterium]|nr:endo-1,4-beta-xylanase [Chthoniobacteraceae bacterium]
MKFHSYLSSALLLVFHCAVAGQTASTSDAGGPLKGKGLPNTFTQNLVNPLGWHKQFAPADATAETMTSTIGGKIKDVVSLRCLTPSQPFYKLIYGQTIAASVPSGDRLRLTFQARSETHNPVRVVLEKVDAPYTSITEVNATLTPEWQSYSSAGTSLGFGPNGMGLRIQFGHKSGTLELTGIKVEDVGMDPAIIAARQALSPESINARIEKYRKGDLVITVKDGLGKPIHDAKVHVEMKRHAFLFGCNIFGLNPADNSAAQRAYRDRFAALFNYATLPFYWGSFEPEKGKPQYDRLNAMALWCNEHQLITKGHPLVWHEVYPNWAPNDAESAVPLLKQRVTDIIRYYAQPGHAQIHLWDVVNEANAARYYFNGEAAWIKRDGPAKVVGTALQWARDADKDKRDTFLYNDFNTGDDNLALLTALKTANALPDVIGIQSHMHGGTWPLDHLWATVEEFSKFGRPIHFTETTVISGASRDVDYKKTLTDWNTTPEGEQKQSDYVGQFYTVLFSHPNVRAITWWDFSDSDAWLGAPSGLLRKDMSPKPVYDLLMKKIHHDWWTDVNGTTGIDGLYRTRAFYGDYLISATDAQGHSGNITAAFPMECGERGVTIILK